MTATTPSQETLRSPCSGFGMLAVAFLLLAGAITCFAMTGSHNVRLLGRGGWVALGMASLLGFALVMPGFFVVNPNTSRVLVLFGRYRGTVREAGFWWTNPFTVKGRVSLRAHTLNGQKIKVNDLLGNPIEIAAVVVWKVRDTAQASFDVEKYAEFVETQSESAVRHLASSHPYDEGQATGVATTLRGSREEVARELQTAVQERLERAGIEVLEARISHLAYAAEIASAMLQRQQAAAVIAARAMIVEGAVGMVEHALTLLAEKKVLDLDADKRAQMVSNLLVVLCSHAAPSPVLNAGTIYG